MFVVVFVVVVFLWGFLCLSFWGGVFLGGGIIICCFIVFLGGERLLRFLDVFSFFLKP